MLGGTLGGRRQLCGALCSRGHVQQSRPLWPPLSSGPAISPRSTWSGLAATRRPAPEGQDPSRGCCSATWLSRHGCRDPRGTGLGQPGSLTSCCPQTSTSTGCSPRWGQVRLPRPSGSDPLPPPALGEDPPGTSSALWSALSPWCVIKASRQMAPSTVSQVVSPRGATFRRLCGVCTWEERKDKSPRCVR